MVALALSLTVGGAPCAWATLYTIPGTTQQIDFQNNSDPQFQLSDDEINQILNYLSQYPPNQLARIKVLQILPSDQPNNPIVGYGGTPDTARLYVPNLQTRTNSLPQYYVSVNGALATLAWNNLTWDKVLEWDTFNNFFPGSPSGQSDFMSEYFTWTESSAAGLLNSLQTDTSFVIIRDALFLAAFFTDWQTDLIYLYKPISGASGPTKMTTAPVTLTPTLWAFGNYQLFLSGKTVIGYQIGTMDPVYWSTNNAQPLPSVVIPLLYTLSASCTPTTLAFTWSSAQPPRPMRLAQSRVPPPVSA